jgi:hypothetical protein
MKLEHTGLHVNRTFHPSSALEKAFADQWHDENDVTRRWAGTTRVLDALMRAAGTVDKNLMSPLGDSRPYHFPDGVTQRDATVAATVIQWLGSNVGRSFLEEALKRDGRWRLVYDPVAGTAREARIALERPREHHMNCDSLLTPSDSVAGITGKPCNCGADKQ